MDTQLWWPLLDVRQEDSEFQRLDRDSPPVDDSLVGRTCWNVLCAEAVAGAAMSGQDGRGPPWC